MAGKFSHKVVFTTPRSVFTLRVHKKDTLEGALMRYSSIYASATHVTVQEYPLKNNEKRYIKGFPTPKEVKV